MLDQISLMPTPAALDDQHRDRGVGQAEVDGVEQQREVERADGAGRERAGDARERERRRASRTPGRDRSSAPSSPTATRSAATTHAVATIGSSTTIQPITPAAAMAIMVSSVGLTPPTPRRIASRKITLVRAACAATMIRLQDAPSARWDRHDDDRQHAPDEPGPPVRARRAPRAVSRTYGTVSAIADHPGQHAEHGDDVGHRSSTVTAACRRSARRRSPPRPPGRTGGRRRRRRSSAPTPRRRGS